jgi:acetyltransferase-like isoleucine patch superfamily enzyme
VEMEKLLQFFHKVFHKKVKRTSLKDLYPDYEIGLWTYADGGLHVRKFGGDGTLKIGAFSSIASGVKIFLGGEHNTDWVSTYPFNAFWKEAFRLSGHPRTKGDVVIGNDVWIGSEAVILSGVEIGNGAVVGLRSVVTQNIPPYAIAVGSPARVVRMRFDDKTISRLMVAKWWDLEETQIKNLLPLLMSSNIVDFLRVVEDLRDT